MTTRRSRIRVRRARAAALLGVLGAAAAVLAIVLAGHGSGSSGAHAARSRAGRARAATRTGASAGAPRRREQPLLALPAHAPARVVHVPILTWHRVAVLAQEYTKSIPDETVEPSVFAAQIDALASHGYHPIGQRRLFDALFHGAALPAKPVLLTIDDGYVDDVKTILPILRAHRFVATFYVITRRLHEAGFLNATEIRRLDAAGMDVGAHTRTHVPLASVPAAEMVEQVAGSRRDLERIVGHPVQWFAYPFGSHDAAVVAELRRAGFVLAVTTEGGTSESSQASLELPRIHVGRSAGVATVLACSSGAACGGGEGSG